MGSCAVKERRSFHNTKMLEEAAVRGQSRIKLKLEYFVDDKDSDLRISKERNSSSRNTNSSINNSYIQRIVKLHKHL